MGGVWNHAPGVLKKDKRISVPQLDPNEPVEGHVWHASGHKDGKPEATFLSPVYDTLETNLPKELMRFSDLPFAPDVPVLPPHGAVLKYVDDYAQDIKDLIQFETQVNDLRPSSSDAQKWTLTRESLRAGTSETSTYDAVVVASGHYDAIYLPDIGGIRAWNQAYPGAISHSKFYDSPASFQDKKVLVVGNGASGIDIGAQIGTVSKGSLLRTERSESYIQLGSSPGEIRYPEVVEFLSPASHDRAVRFADGRIESEIDSVVFCTGYLYSFPFLHSLDPPVITDGRRTVNTYQHLFYTYNPTLAFPVMTQRIVPFPFSESQAAVVARVWSGRLTLPSQADRKVWEDNLIAERGTGTFFHFLPFPQDAEAMDILHDWAANAEKRPGLTNEGTGKLPPYWTKYERLLRENVMHIRKAFVAKGKDRSAIKSAAELGFTPET